MKKHITSGDLCVAIERKTEEILKKKLENIDEIVEQQFNHLINSILCNALGMKSEWGDEVDVDHTNGRQTEIANRVGAQVAQALDAKIPGWVESLMAGKKWEQLKSKWQKAFDNEMGDQLGRCLSEKAEQAAKEIAEEKSEELTKRAMVQFMYDAKAELEAAIQNEQDTEAAAERLDMASKMCATKVASILE